jgi:hypothetical protein
VIKNQNAYYQQARVEVGILQLLNGRLDPHNEHHIVRLHDAFVHRGHLCLAFEQLGINLFELLKRNGFRGLSLGLLRLFLEQVRVCVSRGGGSGGQEEGWVDTQRVCEGGKGSWGVIWCRQPAGSRRGQRPGCWWCVTACRSRSHLKVS